MTGDLLDIVLIVAAVGFGISGYRQGFLVGVLSFLGLLGGAIAGSHLAPPLGRWFGVRPGTAWFGLVAVFVGAAVGQLLASILGTALRRRLTWRPLAQLDSLGGAAVSVAALLVVSWFLGDALAHGPIGVLSREVQHSRVLTAVDKVMPGQLRTWNAELRRELQQGVLPEIFGGLGPDPVKPIGPPDPRLVDSPAVRAARPDIVKILGDAPSCQRRLEGSGFLFASEHVMTNAHVVAGVRDPSVVIDNGAQTLPATVVLFDPNRDVAVLYVPGLTRAPLAFGPPVGPGTDAIVVGYPEDGPFTPVAARVRVREEARGTDIYSRSQVTREIYEIRAVVRPGNSGGPLLSPGARVDGVVFASSTDNADTGFALTAAEVASDASSGADATSPVSTQSCD